ncbi:potassium/proton antiporter [Dokdonella fugitiva]|jgi:cell volume regulation protein A|uniref:potassium/proton antiporter n=1 Tax=Dokdonella fugitiva TaxID=328517 RepID=UPI0015FA973F|nr:potassium/proton antiporter [Dokdonella fugitiva]MBA8882645.1 cell volume regulation protein A [Dokdonella fugitiva]
MNAIHDTYWLLAGAAALVLVGIGSSLIARRFGAPLLLVFLVVGMLAGVDGPGGIHFDDIGTTYRIGSLALAVILFDGGLRTRRESFRGVSAPTLLLATVGVVVTAALTSLAARALLGLGPVQALLLGSVVASTDAAAVFFLLRAGGLQLRSRVGATLEIESSANDPVAVLLTTLLAEYLAAPSGVAGSDIVFELALQFGVGALGGALGGFAIAAAMRKLPLSGGLAALFLVAAALFVFGVTGWLHGSAFLAVYFAGVIVGNRNVPGFSHLLSVLDAGTWLCQIAMFLVLGLLATPHTLGPALLPALGVAAFLMVVGRPLAVTLCLAPFGYGKREIGFVAWVGLRGAVGIFLASIPMLMRLPNAQLIFNVAFIVVLASLLVQGWTLGLAARLLDVALPHRDRAVRRVELDLPGSLEREMVGYAVAPGAAILGDASLPGWAQLAMIVRGGEILMPETGGALQGGDYAYLLAPPGRVYRLDWLFAPPEEAREAEREMFGEFSFDADVRLADVAEFYAVPVRAKDAPLTLAEHFARRYEHTVEVGDRVRLGPVSLVARELDDEGVRKVGLKLERLGNVLVRRPWLARLLPKRFVAR